MGVHSTHLYQLQYQTQRECLNLLFHSLQMLMLESVRTRWASFHQCALVVWPKNSTKTAAKPVTATKIVTIKSLHLVQVSQLKMFKKDFKKMLCVIYQSFPVPSLCRVQLVKSASDVYPQVLDSKLQEPGNSWLWAWMVALSTRRKRRKEERGNGKYESWQLALTETCPHAATLA